MIIYFPFTTTVRVIPKIISTHFQVGDGQLRSCFSNTHGGARVTALAFDSNQRRLITGADTGELKVRSTPGFP